MSYLNFESRYDRFPETKVPGFEGEAWEGWGAVTEALKLGAKEERVIIVDCYPGTDDKEILPNIREAVHPDTEILTEDLFYSGEKLTQMMAPNLTDDRVRGVMYFGRVTDFIDPAKLEEAKSKAKAGKKVLVYGFAAALVSTEGLLVYADMARWELQLRYRRGMPNYKQTNYSEDVLKKNKRGFFIEWRIADRHKETLYEKIDLYLDTNVQGLPKMTTGKALLSGLKQLTLQPFRLVPYFDPGVWGGQWMKEVCHLDPKEKNYAWSFDGVPEENSLYLNIDGVRVETPAMNLTLYQPKGFIGERNYARFGAEFPIRFDFLDTMGGQNLSLQVHPTTEYMYRKFGMHYTQDESYYILDCGKDGGVYLGFKEGIDKEKMLHNLEEAQKGLHPFDAEKYVNRWPAKKYDHFLIPAGTIHCSSANCMVLEVSATPYIFTFKLWDWDRLGLDGLPRPIHIEDGKQVLQYDRTTEWVKENLVSNFKLIQKNPSFEEVKTGLHRLEFIETHVFTVYDKVSFHSDGEVAMCNLVEGQEAVIESATGTFEPYTVHYAETFIIPAAAGDVTIRSTNGEVIKVLRANVRQGETA